MATRINRSAIVSTEDSTREVLQHSKDFVQHYFAHDYEWCLKWVSDDFMWIGATRDQYSLSRADFEKVLESVESSSARSTVTDEEYSIVARDDTLCSVAGHFLVLTPPDAERILAQWHRCTQVWKKSADTVELVHFHLSSPKDYVEQGESYPIHTGTETYRYMKSLMRLGSSRKAVSLYDVDGTVHWVHPSQIIYLEANRKRTIVHCITKDIVVPAVIRDAVEMVDGKIMRVHRSYAVNCDHVVELKAGMLLLDDGTSIAIPAKRIADVRAGLTGR